MLSTKLLNIKLFNKNLTSDCSQVKIKKDEMNTLSGHVHVRRTVYITDCAARHAAITEVGKSRILTIGNSITINIQV